MDFSRRTTLNTGRPERERERERERQTDRQTDRETERERLRQRQRDRDRELSSGLTLDRVAENICFRKQFPFPVPVLVLPR